MYVKAIEILSSKMVCFYPRPFAYTLRRPKIEKPSSPYDLPAGNFGFNKIMVLMLGDFLWGQM